MDAPLAHARAHAARFVEELGELVRFPTVAAQPAHRGDMERCARWLAAHLESIGLEHAQMVPTSGHPFVYADRLRGDGRPTLLVYGHYDVQPADERWHTPPFQPTVRGDFLYGRGASDDKGQFFVHVKAIESWLRSTGGLPLDVKVVVEGEEEIGSRGLIGWLSRQPQALQSDAAVISDMPMRGPGRPAITYAMRGSLSLDVEVARRSPEVHSGLFGGAVPNPIQILCELCASLHDGRGRVAVKGFYDRVRPVGERERAYLRRVGPSDEEMLKDAGLRHGWGDTDFTLYERTTIRPALTFNGCGGGYGGEGGKAVIPQRASAKLNLRLVPDQDPAEVERLVRAHLAARDPQGITVEARTRFAARPVLVDPGHPAVDAAGAAYRDGFGRAPVLLRSGGTLPVASVLQHAVGLPVLMMGFALPDDRMHGPDERFSLDHFRRGITTSVSLLARLPAALRQARPTAAAGGDHHDPWPAAATP